MCTRWFSKTNSRQVKQNMGHLTLFSLGWVAMIFIGKVKADETKHGPLNNF
jgi:hypothetical protein